MKPLEIFGQLSTTRQCRSDCTAHGTGTSSQLGWYSKSGFLKLCQRLIYSCDLLLILLVQSTYNERERITESTTMMEPTWVSEAADVGVGGWEGASTGAAGSVLGVEGIIEGVADGSEEEGLSEGVDGFPVAEGASVGPEDDGVSPVGVDDGIGVSVEGSEVGAEMGAEMGAISPNSH